MSQDVASRPCFTSVHCHNLVPADRELCRVCHDRLSLIRWNLRQQDLGPAVLLVMWEDRTLYRCDAIARTFSLAVSDVEHLAKRLGIRLAYRTDRVDGSKIAEIKQEDILVLLPHLPAPLPAKRVPQPIITVERRAARPAKPVQGAREKADDGDWITTNQAIRLSGLNAEQLLRLGRDEEFFLTKKGSGKRFYDEASLRQFLKGVEEGRITVQQSVYRQLLKHVHTSPD